ncbi:MULTISPECIES: hypothetical protein [unclassified Polaromonas]|uniref:hypothetical protein n=1 Tax=unclassified Polaromonas TaxID=2638319 RepID=UPI000F082311|nr:MULTISPECIES: hypothetical protein [unclassified Polaromonas]AYQ28768.1 hypothetical protein DT070_12465 [Polaromonas sp. SP1]QGJ20116.1 hypothetical protein F7R28_18130 [Polaromonas sp. Pch-P]
MSISLLLAIAGTLCGFYYFGLGIAAGGHLLDKERSKSPGERLLLTTFLWSMTPSEFSDEGKKICVRANFVLVAALACWVAWAVFK